MNEREVRAAKCIQTRRALLDAMDMLCPAPATFETLLDCIAYLDVEEHLVRKDVYYLAAKGYLEWVNPEGCMGWSRRTYRLTAAGKEIADHVKRDDALEP